MHSSGLLGRCIYSLTHFSRTRPCTDEPTLAGIQELPDNIQDSAKGDTSAWRGKGVFREGFLEEAGFEQHPEVKKSRGMWVPRWQSSLEATALERGQGLVLRHCLLLLLH